MDATYSAINESSGLLPEDYFQRMLIHERKRTERFGRTFMLVLLNVKQLLKEMNENKRSVAEDLTAAFNSFIREIDLKGWYLKDALLGMICS